MIDPLKDLYEQGKDFLQSGAKTGINALLASGIVQSAINSQIKKYATIHALMLTDGGIRIQAQLLGSRDIFTATATGIEIDSRKKTFRVRHFECDMPWADHILNDFVANRTYPLGSLPSVVINTLAGINALLK